jgi:hypothetical protein
MNPLETAYLAIRVLEKTGHELQIELRSAGGVLATALGPDAVAPLEFRIAEYAAEYQSRVQAAKYAAVCPNEEAR